MAVRGACDRSGIQRQHKAHAAAGKIHLAEAGDLGLDVAAKDVDGDLVTQFQPHLLGLFGGKGYLRRAAVTFGPPLARHHLGAFGHGIGIGDAPIPADHPVIARNLDRILAVDAGHHPAHHRRGFHLGHRRMGTNLGKEGVNLVGLDIDKEIGGRLLRQIACNGAAQIAVDLANGGQHRKPKAQRHDDLNGFGARRADRGQGKPQWHPAAQGS